MNLTSNISALSIHSSMRQSARIFTKTCQWIPQKFTPQRSTTDTRWSRWTTRCHLHWNLRLQCLTNSTRISHQSRNLRGSWMMLRSGCLSGKLPRTATRLRTRAKFVQKTTRIFSARLSSTSYRRKPPRHRRKSSTKKFWFRRSCDRSRSTRKKSSTAQRIK